MLGVRNVIYEILVRSFFFSLSECRSGQRLTIIFKIRIVHQFDNTQQVIPKPRMVDFEHSSHLLKSSAFPNPTMAYIWQPQRQPNSAAQQDHGSLKGRRIIEAVEHKHDDPRQNQPKCRRAQSLHQLHHPNSTLVLNQLRFYLRRQFQLRSSCRTHIQCLSLS